MPIIEIEGQKYDFPDGVTDEQMSDAIEALRPPTVGEDIAKTIPSSLARGVAGVVGLPGDVARGMRWLSDKGRQLLGGEGDPVFVETGRHAGIPENFVSRNINLDPPTSGAVQKQIERVTGELYEPKTWAGRYFNAVGELVPGALGPGAAGGFARYAFAPGVASQAASDMAEGTGYEPYARIAGGLAGLGAANYLMRPNAAPRAVSNALRGVDEQQIADAGRLMMDARVRGVQLTWAEAIDQVTNGRSSLGNLQRVVEASPGGGEVMRPFMAERPAQVAAAFDRQMGDIAAVPMTPSAVGPRASEAASSILERVRRNINARTEPMYQAARADVVPDRTLARLHRGVPGFTQALEYVRTQPNWAQNLAGLPDGSAAVLDAVKRRMRQTAENAGMATNPDRDLFLSSSQGRAADVVDRAARRSSRPYRQAVDEQARARGAELEPLQRSPLGDIADAGDTKAAAAALLPGKPLAGSAAETGRTTRLMAAQDAPVTRNLVRQRLEGIYNTAARDVQSGPSEFAGAAGRARLYGDRQMRRNIQAALSELPNGNQVATGFNRLMEVFQATGRRQRIGSQTAFNQEYQRQLAGGGAVGETLTGMRQAVRQRYQAWRLGRNLDDLARLLTDQNAQQRMIELSRLRLNEPRAQVLAAQLAEDALADTGGGSPLEITIRPRGQ